MSTDIVRGGNAPTSFLPDGAPITPVANSRGEQLVVAALPLKSELTRLGNTWSTQIPAANHFTPVAALPTTRAELVLFNGESAGGKCYVIDSAYVLADTSVAAATSIALLGQTVNSGTAPTDNSACLLMSRSCRKNYGGLARKAIANTVFGVADRWEVIGVANSAPSASIGAAVYQDLYGGYIIPPGGLFLLNAVFSTAAGTAVLGVTWHEVQLDLSLS